MKTNIDESFASGIPSLKLNLLQQLAGAVLVSLTRYSWLPPEEAVSEWAIVPRDMLFSLAAGPILIEIDDGTVFGAASDPSLISIIMWLERDKNGRERSPRLADDTELYPIQATDEQLAPLAIRRLIGRRIESARILERQPELEKWQAYPREVGLLIKFEGDGRLLLSHGLHDDSDDFSVITPDHICKSLTERIHEKII